MNLIKLLVLFTFFASACTPQIVYKPIEFDHKRIILTHQYQKKHYGFKHPSLVIHPKIIVIHWTANNHFEPSFQEMYKSEIHPARTELNQDYLNISAHFLVDRDGTIYQLMPTNWMARHVIGLNPIAIGIENVGGYQGQENLTQAQLHANQYLVHRLKEEYPDIRYVIGHYEYEKFRHTRWWFERNRSYFTKKPDPGKKFMKQLTATIQSNS